MLSTKDAYGSVAVGLHWSIAVLIVAALTSGFVADAAGATGHGALRIHLVTGALTGVLTLVRVVWWWTIDRRPAAWENGAKRLVMTVVHGLLVLLPLVMLASGIGMMVQSGAMAQLFGGAAGALPNFEDIRPRRPHGLAAILILAFVAVHVGAALYHQVVLHDGLLGRMWPRFRRTEDP